MIIDGMDIDTSDLRKEKKRIGADFKELSDKLSLYQKKYGTVFKK